MDIREIKQKSFIYKNIIESMSEGVLTVDLKGVITSFNSAAAKILQMKKESVINRKCSEIFFDYAENDDFNQTILDAIYESSISHNRVVNFYTGEKFINLFITTSFLQTNEGDEIERIGVIAVFSDITELQELRDAVLAMEKIKKLNQQLELRNQFISETFGRYVSDEVVSNLIDKPGALKLGGEKKQVSVMMTDLRGFSALSEQLPPETVVVMLNNYLGTMVDILLKYNGTILEFVGDGIVVVFGAPIWLEDHATKSVACAIEMQLAMEKVNQWNVEKGYPEIEMGIGIDTGQVIVGNIGSKKRTRYGIIGKHVNLAARIESYTAGGQVFISRETLGEMVSVVIINNQMEVTPKGITTPITIYEINGIGEPYNLILNEQELGLTLLPKEIPINIFLVENKQCVGNMISGRLLKLSVTEAEIYANEVILPMSDLKIQVCSLDGKVISGDIYAKVTNKETVCSSHIHVQFTWISKEGKTFLKHLTH